MNTWYKFRFKGGPHDGEVYVLGSVQDMSSIVPPNSGYIVTSKRSVPKVHKNSGGQDFPYTQRVWTLHWKGMHR